MMEENLPPGFRFHPTDEELITCYLSRKVSDCSFAPRAIAVVDLNKCEPWDLPARASMGEKEWYFFNLRDRKYPTGLRTNRATEAGYWKTTGKDKEITRADTIVGMKKTLVFYRGRAPKGEKSNWVMHEYRLENKHSYKANKEEWVVCRIFKKSAAVAKKSLPTPTSLPYLESPNDEDNTIADEYGDIELANLNSFANTNSSVFSNISIQDYNGENNLNLSMNNMNNNMNNMDMNNWATARQLAAAGSNLPSFPWTSSLLSSNLSMNSLLVKALQMRNYNQPSDQAPSSSSDYYSFMPQGISQYGTDFNSNLTAAASSSKVDLDPLQQLQPQEQPFNKMDSFDW